MYDELLVYDAHSLNSDNHTLSLRNVINDIKNKKPKNILFLSIYEYEMPHVTDKNEYDELEKLLLDYNIIFYILVNTNNTDGLQSFQLKQNFVYLFWPTSFLHYYYYRTKEIIFSFKPKRNFEKIYNCLNGKARYHRVKLIDSLYKNDLFDNGIITWNQLTSDYNEGRKCDFKFWNEKILISDDKNYFKDVYNYNFFFDLVSETTSSHYFFTEKTYRPLLFNQIFLCLGHRNINKNLKNFGFEIFEEIFNYDFDSNENLESRIDGIVNNIKNLKNKNLDEIFKLIEPKLDYNKNKCIEIINHDSNIPEKFIQLYRDYRDSFGNYLKFYNLDRILKNL